MQKNSNVQGIWLWRENLLNKYLKDIKKKTYLGQPNPR
jgi:hypothetical protein